MERKEIISSKDYVHVALVIDFVQAMLAQIVNLTKADTNDACLIIASELKKAGILDESNFLKHCRKLLYINNKPTRIH